MSCCFQDYFTVFGFRQFEYNMSWSRSLSLSYLEFVKLLGFIDSCLSSNWGIFCYFFKYALCSFLFFWESHNEYISRIGGVTQVPYTLFLFLHSFFCFLESIISVVLFSSLLILQLVHICLWHFSIFFISVILLFSIIIFFF